MNFTIVRHKIGQDIILQSQMDSVLGCYRLHHRLTKCREPTCFVDIDMRSMITEYPVWRLEQIRS